MRVALSGRSSNTIPDGLSGLRLRAEELDDAEVIIAVRREEISAGMTLTLERMRIVLAG